jgi:hypothetical protein
MAKFLDGAGVQAALIEIIKNAETELYLRHSAVNFNPAFIISYLTIYLSTYNW